MSACVARDLSGQCKREATHKVSATCEKGHDRTGDLCEPHVWSIQRGENPGCRECLEADEGHVPLAEIHIMPLATDHTAPGHACNECR
jgi:hypothetical protein